ncbi:MAG TPA: HAD family hydrolase [Pyrinomonadaceae bacterium]|nr:HAD family hydrolase [Pyrinomonadaceae bacterium]
MSSRPAVFLDRDGTLIKEVNFLSRVEDLEIFDFTFNALEKLKSAGFGLIVVTNQSGIGRGLYTEADMHAIHREMDVQLDRMIDSYYFCPHLPDDGCHCRKPGIGMIESACLEQRLSIEGSWMIGDKDLDVKTAFAANLRSAMVLTGYGSEHQVILKDDPEIIAEDLGEAVERILAIS